MPKKTPIVATRIPLAALFQGFKGVYRKRNPIDEWAHYFNLFLNTRQVFSLNSGSASLFVILQALQKRSTAGEVVLPAYCADALVVAVQKAKLKPVLCDMNLDDFNLDLNSLPRCIGPNTLCVLGVHMFGIAASGLKDWKKNFSSTPLIEDCAQALGSRLNGALTGNLGETSFFSFNRGKNLPTYGGGCIATSDAELSARITEHMAVINEEPWRFKLSIPWKIICLAILANRQIYGFAYPFIRHFKERATPRDFPVKKYTAFQAAVALSLLKRSDESSKVRYNNGMRLIRGLDGLSAVITPKIPADSEPAFNRLPVLFKDLSRRDAVEKKLLQEGIETSRMYLRPLHHAFSLGYKKSDFPNANYLAEHLLTFPVHPLLGAGDIDTMIRVIRESAGA